MTTAHFIRACILLYFVAILLATLASAHPGDHDHCEQTPTGTQQCH